MQFNNQHPLDDMNTKLMLMMPMLNKQELYRVNLNHLRLHKQQDSNYDAFNYPLRRTKAALRGRVLNDASENTDDALGHSAGTGSLQRSPRRSRA